jgi:uncharacterized protein
MAKTVLVDSGYLVALLNRNDQYREWAAAQAGRLTYPWITCEAALSEAFHLLGRRGAPQLAELLQRGVALPKFNLESELPSVLSHANELGRCLPRSHDGDLRRSHRTNHQ